MLIFDRQMCARPLFRPNLSWHLAVVVPVLNGMVDPCWLSGASGMVRNKILRLSVRTKSSRLRSTRWAARVDLVLTRFCFVLAPQSDI